MKKRVLFSFFCFWLVWSYALPLKAQWSAASLSAGPGSLIANRSAIAATSVGNKALFAGGSFWTSDGRGPYQTDQVDIYDNITSQWTTAKLSQPRTNIGAGYLGDLAFFAGGANGGIFLTNNYSRVDIYNNATSQWTTAELSLARARIAVASAGSKILFAGGATYSFASGGSNIPYNVVDIYDVATNQWSVTQLPRLSGYITAATVGSKIFFANDGIIDIYDVNTGQWTAGTIPQAKNLQSSTSLGNKVFFAGGFPADNRVDIYDVATNQWSTAALSQPSTNVAAITLGSKAFFGTGNVLDIYDAASNQWSMTQFPRVQTDGHGTTSLGNKVFFAGIYSNFVDIYTVESVNTPPTSTSIANQTVVVGQPVSINVASAFTDAETPSSLSLTARGLPQGLTLINSTISGITTTTGITSVTITATDPGSLSVSTSFTLTVKAPALNQSLSLVPPTYDCQTGVFRFNTTGGDGTQVEYYAVPGITGWTTNPDQLVDTETRTAADAQPITLRVRQSGKEVVYIWDIRAQCPVGNSSILRFASPTYNCQSGAFIFNTTGGDGSPIEFMAIGITGWTMNPNQFVDFETRTAADAPIIILRARQNGREVTYSWDIRAVCPIGSFRAGSGAELGDGLQIRVLGNPVVDGTVRFEVRGAEGQPLRLLLTNASGTPLGEQRVNQAGAVETQTLELTNQPSGVLLLKASTPTQSRTVKVLKGE